LPGLINHHTGASLPEEDVVACKKEYNEWLSFVKKRQEQLREAPDKEKPTLINHMEHWLSEMYECLQKIGQYTHEETTKGFEV
jgi:hypothetical protein